MISVILPVYNGQRYLRASILSVLEQRDVDFELIIVDDASTDSSPEIIDDLSHHPEIKSWSNEENRGLFHTLNKAVKLCSYSYIKVWAQDDVMKPDCLRSFVDVMAKTARAGFFWCQSEVVGESWEWEQDCLIPRSPVQEKEGLIFSERWSLAKSIGHFFWCGNLHGNISLLAFHKSAFELISGFDESFIYSGDIDFTARLLSTRTPVCIPLDLVWLRNHSGQLSRSSEHLMTEMLETKSVFSFLRESHTVLLSGTDLGRFCEKSYAYRSLPYFVSNSLLLVREWKLRQGLSMLWALNPGVGIINSIWFWAARRVMGYAGPELRELRGLGVD